MLCTKSSCSIFIFLLLFSFKYKKLLHKPFKQNAFWMNVYMLQVWKAQPKKWHLEEKCPCHIFHFSIHHNWRKLKDTNPLLSARPFHRVSVLTFLSINFFQSIPSEMTLDHSLETAPAAQRDLASRNDRMFSATWSRPWR